jgi:glycosyltransferase involved in cell wall biosynthesis
VVIPAFNAAPWVGAALRSVARQQDTSMEIILVDDGSTDATVELASTAMVGVSNFKLIRSEHNLGIVAALNRGIDEARGRYIARMDADDLCMPNRFARQIDFLETTRTDLCGSWFTEFGQGFPRNVRWPHAQTAVHAAMMFQNAICHPTVMARREVMQELRYREGYRLAEDYDLFSRACGAYRLANVPAVLLRYRRHPRQSTQAKRSSMEDVTRRIRIEALRRQGFDPSPEEQRLHNLIRAPSSIYDADDLQGIENWLLKLHLAQQDQVARQVIASQWIRACIRAAPLRHVMWHAFRKSSLYAYSGAGPATDADIYLLSRLGLHYRSRPFEILRRLGMSA